MRSTLAEGTELSLRWDWSHRGCGEGPLGLWSHLKAALGGEGVTSWMSHVAVGLPLSHPAVLSWSPAEAGHQGSQDAD